MFLDNIDTLELSPSLLRLLQVTLDTPHHQQHYCCHLSPDQAPGFSTGQDVENYLRGCRKLFMWIQSRKDEEAFHKISPRGGSKHQ